MTPCDSKVISAELFEVRSALGDGRTASANQKGVNATKWQEETRSPNYNLLLQKIQKH